MSTTTPHTPEPWEVSGTSIIAEEICIAVIEDDGGYEAPREEREANADRIVACVNALAGIEDPADAIQHAKDALETLAENLEAYPDDCEVEHSLADIARQALAALTPKPGHWDGIDPEEFVRSVRDGSYQPEEKGTK